MVNKIQDNIIPTFKVALLIIIISIAKWSTSDKAWSVNNAQIINTEGLRKEVKDKSHITQKGDINNMTVIRLYNQ